MCNSDMAVVNPQVVLRIECEGRAMLFNPDTTEGYGLNQISLFIWNRLDGKHSVDDIVTELKVEFTDVPDDIRGDVNDFIKDLVEVGMAGYDNMSSWHSKR